MYNELESTSSVYHDQLIFTISSFIKLQANLLHDLYQFLLKNFLKDSRNMCYIYMS